VRGLSNLRRWFDWDVANFKGTLTFMLAMVPAVLTALNFGAYSEGNSSVWAFAIGFAILVGGTALWCGFIYEWREMRSINEQIRAESLEETKIRDRD
jgi:hypothetical protein